VSGRPAAAAAVLVAVLASGCDRVSDAEVDQAIAGWTQVWSDYLDAVEQAVPEGPDAMIAAGERQIAASQGSIDRVRGLLARRGTQAQIERVRRAIDKDGGVAIETRLTAIRKQLAARPGTSAAEVEAAARRLAEQARALERSLRG